MNNQEIILKVTTRIIKQLENGVKPWECAWNRSSSQFAIPSNLRTGEEYHGINIPILWEATDSNGYTTNLWVGFDQAKQLGGYVRKNEKGTHGVIYKPLVIEDDGEDESKRTVPMLKTFVVFNLDQIADLDHLRPKVTSEEATFAPILAAEELLRKSGAKIIDGGNKAFYRSTTDRIGLPNRSRFKLAEDYYSTGLHELTHWTGHKKRLNRTWGKRFGDDAYAFEELVAEMGSAFLCAKLGLQGNLQHANYIDGWLKVLKSDYRALIKAASQAQAAFDYLNALVEETETSELGTERLVA